MAQKMQAIFDKYWNEKDCNLPLGIALVLDPRYKLEYLSFCLSELYNEVEVSEYTSLIEDTLHRLYYEYASFYQGSNPLKETSSSIKNVEQANSFEPKKKDSLSRKFRKKKKEQSGMESGKSEIEVYLADTSANFDDEEEEEAFDILLWWKANSGKYQILSKMARDFLAILISTVASEYAFSTGGRVLNEKRSRLDPSTVEALVCTQDWIRGMRKANN